MAKKEGIDAIKAQKLARIKSAMKNIDKQLKQEGVVQILGEAPAITIDRFSSGSLLFDIALGGGLPKGRIVEFFGLESSGKTLCATRAAAEVQKAGGYVAFIDMEHAFSPAFARMQGLNTDELIFVQPNTMEEAFEVIDQLIESGGVDLIILDSIASLVPKEELEGDVDKNSIGLVARGLSKFLRRITGKLSQTRTTLIAINQVRDSIGGYGNPETTPGGKALKFYASIRCRISKVSGSNETAKRGAEDVVVAYGIRASCVKNKTAPPFRKAEFKVSLDGRVFDKVNELAEAAILGGMFVKIGSDGQPNKNGRTYVHPAEPEFKAVNRASVADELRNYPNLQEVLIDQLTNGAEVDPDAQPDSDEDMDPDAFEATLESGNDAEEGSWDEL